ncbi:DUF929 family protein [Acidianus manzaensis]|uniref:DUF929 domain-containing protein n=1 Tax=Acidianus manzaensis TaxID=282676 RepID=A0A1W6K2U2_9CREN|nr:DUF929 family protein [Acidianus manzaensis]ARM76810.1 hypothetical protein B6F84_12800 [Acidianus manzaensis]
MNKSKRIRNLSISILVVVVVMIGIIILSDLHSTSQDASIIGKPISQSLYNNLIQISNSGYNISVTNTSLLHVMPYNFSSDGKPAVIFVGAEWCPFCAAERWALSIALMRFGNLSNLEYMLSSSSDIYPNTPTFTFVNSSYTSKYITFIPIEYENRNHQTLQPVPENVYNVWTEYGDQSIPFIIIGNYYEVGTPIDPGLLSGKNWTYVINQLHNQSSEIYKQIYEEANLLTYAICHVDGEKPYSVCHQFIQIPHPNTTQDSQTQTNDRLKNQAYQQLIIDDKERKY